MCLTMPKKIKRVGAGWLETDDGRRLGLGLTEAVAAGDWVLAAADLCVAKISAAEAKEIKSYFTK